MDEAVLDVEQVEGAEPGAETTQDTENTVAETAYDPFESKSARELSAWLKGLRDADPANAKHARALKDIFGQQFAFKKEFPTGLDGAREMKTLLDSVIHHDRERGELKGAEAVAALQDSVREYAEIDELLAQGDPKALESLGEDFNAGLAKLAPTILDRIQQSDPEAYANAVLPHFVQALAKSELVSSYNAMVDVLEEKPPSWLTEQQKSAWAADQQRKVVSLAASMGSWINAQAKRAGEIPQGGKTNGTGKPALSEREAAFNQKEQDYHWNTNINPKMDQHAGVEFSKLFAPYAKRLNLDATASSNLKMEFSKRVAAQAAKDKVYMGQLNRYRSMKNPDPATVLNFAKVNFDKHSKTVMDGLVNERYKSFLNGKPKTSTPNATGSHPAPSKGIQVVTVRPPDDQINHKARTLDQIHKKIFPLFNGKVVQVRA